VFPSCDLIIQLAGGGFDSMGTGVGAREGRVLVCRKTPRGLKPKTGFLRDRNFHSEIEEGAGSLSADVESGGRWKMQEGGFAADCRLVTQTFVLPLN
jgi:hypothetical protein